MSKRRQSKIENCSFIYCLFFRKNCPEGPAYCIEITCTVHKPKASWHALTNSLEQAVGIINEFPIVSGGLSSAEDCFPPHPDCIIGKIPGKAKLIEEV